MNKIINQITTNLNKLSIPNLLLAIAIGLVGGYFLELLKLNNVVLAIASMLVVGDFLYTWLKLKRSDLLLSKTVAYILLFILAKGLANFLSLSANYAAIFGVFYYSIADIWRAFKDITKKDTEKEDE